MNKKWVHLQEIRSYSEDKMRNWLRQFGHMQQKPLNATIRKNNKIVMRNRDRSNNMDGSCEFNCENSHQLSWMQEKDLVTIWDKGYVDVDVMRDSTQIQYASKPFFLFPLLPRIVFFFFCYLKKAHNPTLLYL